MNDVTLSESQRQLLEKIAAEVKSGPVYRRAQLLLLYGDGKSSEQVSQEVGLSLTQVRYWRRQFLEEGWSIFPEPFQPSVDQIETDPRIAEGTAVEAEARDGETTVAEPAKPLATAELSAKAEHPAAVERSAEADQAGVQSADSAAAEKDQPPAEPGPTSQPPAAKLVPGQAAGPIQSSPPARPPLDPREPVTPQRLREYSNPDLRHSDYVRELALLLFEGTRPLHRLSAHHQRLLLTAAELFDLARNEKGRPDPRASRKLILSRPLVDFEELDQHAVALIVRHQRGGVKPGADAGEGIPPYFYRETMILTAILRIAIGLSQAPDFDTQIEKVIPDPGTLVLQISGTDTPGTARRAEDASSLWSKIFFQNVRIIPAQPGRKGPRKDLPLPEPFKAPSLEPWDMLSEAGRKVLLYNFAEMLAHEEGTRDGSDIEDLHDMRVATRRMRVAFEIFKRAFVTSEVKPYIKGLRTAGRTLGRVRDRDVFLEKADKYLAGHPEQGQGLLPLKHFWEQERESYRQEMLSYLNSPSYRRFVEDFNLFLHTPGAGAVSDHEKTASMQVRYAAPSMIYECLGKVRSYQRILHSASIEQLHQLRIDFKRLRYTMEYFREVLGSEAKWIIDEIKKVQDHLGDLNDADVACTILNNFLRDWEGRQMQQPLSERLNPEPIVAYLAVKHAERHHLMLSFEETWAAFDRPEFMQQLALAISVL